MQSIFVCTCSMRTQKQLQSKDQEVRSESCSVGEARLPCCRRKAKLTSTASACAGAGRGKYIDIVV